MINLKVIQKGIKKLRFKNKKKSIEEKDERIFLVGNWIN